MALWLVRVRGEPRLARGPAGDGPTQLLAADLALDDLLSIGPDAVTDALDGPAEGPVPTGARTLAPVGAQEIWAAGVTYPRSRDARLEESTGPDHYDRVYDADRPELFFKAPAWRARGPGETIGVRADSTWDVPEPELGVVADAAGRIVGYVLGNDVSSRSIEGANPLYLPQAKCYQGSCAVGPCIVPLRDAPALGELTLAVRVDRDGRRVYGDRVEVSAMRRSPGELVDWLFAALDFPVGAVLLTGTGLVPDRAFTLQPGDEVTVAADGLGELRNFVREVGRQVPVDAEGAPL